MREQIQDAYKGPNPKIVAANVNILGTHINGAMQDMIKISQRLVSIAEQETQKLVQNDVLGFAYLQDEKDKFAKQYVQASKEFRMRISEFRGVDQGLLTRLNDLQTSLATKTRENNVIVERMKDKARANTQNTLFTTQELAQEKIIRLEARTREMARNSQEDISGKNKE